MLKDEPQGGGTPNLLLQQEYANAGGKILE
jgi:hypothetical protein